jgi:oleandomycin transport system permease protein
MSLLASPLRTARQGRTLGWRAILKIRHSPDLLLDIIALPVVFVLMYVFLFGNAISGNWHAYLQFVLPGIAVQAMMFGSLGTALALNTDLRTGIFDRFRSLPIGRPAPLIGQVLGDLVKYAVSLVLVFGLGAALGFRAHGDPAVVLAGLGLIMAFAFAMSWVAMLLGTLASKPESVQVLSFVVIFPLTFASNVFVPTGKLPGWLQAWVKINPVTQLASAARALILNQPAGSAVGYAIAWSAGIRCFQMLCAPKDPTVRCP